MEKLIFGNPVFNKGLNLTVRRGSKWNNHSGEQVQLTDLNDKSYGEVVIWTEPIEKFSDLKERDLSHEHEPSCRTYDGLLKGMIEPYEGFTEEENVTLVWFNYEGGS